MTSTPTSAEGHRGPANRLAGESSPYLLAHQYNPVDWYPWGEEARARARAEHKPIFLSVGYSTCYWCHVMERESFSNPEIAELMNRHFVNVKVDREERPDVDEIYMTATQILNRGSGGWPNSVFLTPQLRPFFAGTYFPPEDRYGRPGFATLLRDVVAAWESRRPEIEAQAVEIAGLMREYLEQGREPATEPPPAATAGEALGWLMRLRDEQWGGFGSAPKFPTPANLQLLLELADESPEAEKHLALSLDRMARGGIYDQLGGGFHRYSTDARWRVPHFEKMLYDNAQLVEVYARWHERTGDPEAARIVRETVAFLDREMSSPQGAFLSAIDAETEGREGAFYVWTRSEIEAAIGRSGAERLAPLLGFEGEEAPASYVLHRPEPIADQAARLEVSPDELHAHIAPLREKLLSHRARRQRPATDDKVLTDWNGLAIAGLAVAGQALGDSGLIDRAARAADFVLVHLRPRGGPLHHSWRQGKARLPACLADYAFFVRGLLALHEATAEDRWRQAAEELVREQSDRLGDSAGGFFTAAERPDLLFRTKDVGDSAVPSANAVAVLNLLALAERTGDAGWRRQASAALRAFAAPLVDSPGRYPTLALATRRFHAGQPQDGTPVAAAKTGAGSQLERLAREVVKVRTRSEATPGDGWRRFAVELEIASGWHVNANPASDEFLIPTRLDVEDGELRHLEYPPGKYVALAFASEEIAVYKGAVTIRGELRAASQPTLVLTYQACDDQRCLPPVRRELDP